MRSSVILQLVYQLKKKNTLTTIWIKYCADDINMLLLRVITKFTSFHDVSLRPFHIVKTLASEKTRPAVNGICTFSANIKGNV